MNLLEGESNASPTEARRVDSFGGPQVCQLVGITYRQLDYWARTDLLQPSVAEARGSGTRRRYAYTDLVELRVIKQLLAEGLSLHATRRAIDCLRDNLGADLASANIVLAGPTSVLARSGEEVIDLVRGGQGVLNIVPLGGLVAELDAKILMLAASPERVRKATSTSRTAGQDRLAAGG